VRIESVALVNRATAAERSGHTLGIDEPSFPIEFLIGKLLIG
jgi:hypothetical protein